MFYYYPNLLNTFNSLNYICSIKNTILLMKKILLVFTLFIISNGFAQIDSQTDKEAIKELYKKLGRYEEGYFNSPLNLIYGITTEEFEGVNRVTKINLPESHSFTNNSNSFLLSGDIDLSIELNKLEKLKEVSLSKDRKVNLTQRLNYIIDFDKLSNLVDLEVLKFTDATNNTSKYLLSLITNNIKNADNLVHLKELSLSQFNSRYGDQKIEIPNFKSLKKLEIFNGFVYSDKFIFNSNIESLRLDIAGDYSQNYFDNLKNLKSLYLKGDYTYLPNSLGNLTSLESLSLNNNIIPKLPATITNLQNLKSIFYSNFVNVYLNNELVDIKSLREIGMGNSYSNTAGASLSIYNKEIINNLTQLETIKILLTTDHQSDLSSFDFAKLNNLKNLEYNIDWYSIYDENDYQNYVLPKNIDKLINLEHLYLTIGNEPQDISTLNKLRNLQVTYNYKKHLPKVDFSKNVNLENLVFMNYDDPESTNSLKFKENDFKDLNKLSYLDFNNIPIDFTLTNKLNKPSLKVLSFGDWNSRIKNNFEGILNLCNTDLEYLGFIGTMPEVIDIRNNQLTPNFLFLQSRNNFSPQFIVDDINKFKQLYGNTYYDYLQEKEIPFNLTTSTEPCERSLTTVNINKTGVKIYPNPVVDILNIETDVNKNSIKIIDLTGKIIESYTINEKKISVQVNHLPKGIYIVEVENENGKTNSKFIKK